MNAARIVMTIPFPGFYESVLSQGIDGEEEQLADYLAGEGGFDHRETPEFSGRTASEVGEALYWCTSYGEAFRHVAKEYAECFAHYLNADAAREGCATFALEYEGMDSPREYNFTTDRCYMALPLADFERMRACCNPPDLAAVIRETFKPRSGFIPFYSDDPEEWADKPSEEFDHNEAGVVLRAFLRTIDADGDDQDYCEKIVDWMHGNNTFGEAVDIALDVDALRARMAREAA